jgi:predicted dehydrogenase
MQLVRIGIIGLGDMANAHIRGLQQAEGTTISAICDVNAEALAAVGERLQIPVDKRYTDYRLLIEDEEVDGVISVTPNAVHATIMKSCIAAGKPFLGEKPFTMTMQEAEEVKDAYEQAGPAASMIGFSYRYTPAFRYARELLLQDKIGQVRSFSIQYLQGWGSSIYQVPFVWRFDREKTGTGALGDLGSHMIDLAHYLIGPFKELSARLETFVTKRKDLSADVMRDVEVDDYASFQATMACGAAGLFQTTRNAIGSGNQLEIAIYGELGTLHASTVNPDQLIWLHLDSDSGEVIEKKLAVPGRVKISQWTDFTNMLRGNPSDGLPDLLDGYHNQKVLEAVIRSNEQKKTVSVYED